MSLLELKYGRSVLHVDLQEGHPVTEVQSCEPVPAEEPSGRVAKAIASPLMDQYTPLPVLTAGKEVAIAINDKTRPVPHEHLLPPLLHYLHEHEIKDRDITFYVASGTHQPMPREELHKILLPGMERVFKVISHDCDDLSNLVNLGRTSRGTPVLVNRSFYEADIKIMVGNIEPHHFMGFSGGMKTAAIGLTGRETINQNHKYLVQPEARIGHLDTNPCRLDVEEIGKKIGVQYALNAVLNSRKEILDVFWGDPLAVMAEGVKMSRSITQVAVSEPFPVVLVSAGGYPKDINLYQAQKALTNAAEICSDGGSVFLVAECSDGAGSQAYLDFMQHVQSPQEVLDRFSQMEFKIGPHKAFQVARIASRVRIHLVSSLSDSLSRQLLFEPNTIQEVEKTLNSLDRNTRLAYMPHGVATIPYFSSIGT